MLTRKTTRETLDLAKSISGSKAAKETKANADTDKNSKLNGVPRTASEKRKETSKPNIKWPKTFIRKTTSTLSNNTN